MYSRSETAIYIWFVLGILAAMAIDGGFLPTLLAAVVYFCSLPLYDMLWSKKSSPGFDRTAGRFTIYVVIKRPMTNHKVHVDHKDYRTERKGTRARTHQLDTFTFCKSFVDVVEVREIMQCFVSFSDVPHVSFLLSASSFH